MYLSVFKKVHKENEYRVQQTVGALNQILQDTLEDSRSSDKNWRRKKIKILPHIHEPFYQNPRHLQMIPVP